MPRSKSATMGIEQFRQRIDIMNSEYKITACDESTLTDINLFTTGINIDDDIDSYFDKFERLAVIYVSRNRALMYFSGN